MADQHAAAKELLEVAGLAYSAKTLTDLQDEVARTIISAAREAHLAGITGAYEVARAISIRVERLLDATSMKLAVEAHSRKQALDRDRGVAA